MNKTTIEATGPAAASPWRTWLLLPLWVYGLFIFVNLAQRAWNLWLGTVFGATLSGQKSLGGLFLTELNGPAWLTGDLFGVEASWLSVLVTGALLTWCLRLRSGSTA